MLDISAMGTWGPGPFDNDAAADFLDRLQGAPARVLAGTLGEIVQAPVGTYLEIDVVGAGWAACEVVALAFGRGDAAAVDDRVLDLVAKVKPSEDRRQLALQALPRIADRATSELAGLWHEGSEGALFDAALANLRARLEAASDGPRALAKPRVGDLIGLPAQAGSTELIAVQVVAVSEVAVFEGVCADEAAARDAVASRPARRVPAQVGKLLRRGRALGNLPVRKDLLGKKLYAFEAGCVDDYFLSTASGGGGQRVSYEGARACDPFHLHDEDAIRAVASGSRPIERVRSPDEREAELCARNAERWAARRAVTAPGPFGDHQGLGRLVQWIEDFGVENAVRRFRDLAEGNSGYGRPSEDSERRSYAFAGLVAVWRGTWPPQQWPAASAVRLPVPPAPELMFQALTAARTLADQIITRDSELRLIWDGADDRGAKLRSSVAALQKALA